MNTPFGRLATLPASTCEVTGSQFPWVPEWSQPRSAVVSGNATVALPQLTAISAALSPRSAGERRRQRDAGSGQVPECTPVSNASNTLAPPLRPEYSAVQPPPASVMSQ